MGGSAPTLGHLKVAAWWRDSALHIEYDFQVSAETNSFDVINYKDPYRDKVCFFSQDQHLFLKLFVSLNQIDVSKYVQKAHLLTGMCREEQMQWVRTYKELIITYIITGTPFIFRIFI